MGVAINDCSIMLQVKFNYIVFVMDYQNKKTVF